MGCHIDDTFLYFARHHHHVAASSAKPIRHYLHCTSHDAFLFHAQGTTAFSRGAHRGHGSRSAANAIVRAAESRASRYGLIYRPCIITASLKVRARTKVCFAVDVAIVERGATLLKICARSCKTRMPRTAARDYSILEAMQFNTGTNFAVICWKYRHLLASGNFRR